MSIRLSASAAAFLSAALLFSAQPHWGRRLAPAVGGGPAVWNACLVFFQTALLAGYVYAFQLLNRWPKRAPLIHAAVLVAASVWCFVGPTSTISDGAASPTVQAILSLMSSIGPPILALSATASLAHRWSMSNALGRAGYGVYAASNAGSLLALLAYPTLIEPALGLADQWLAWRSVFVAFAAAAVVFGMRAQAREHAAATPISPTEPKGRAALRLQWLFWSALPSALLVSTTQKITEDVAGGSLLWLPPLAVFLTASILAFAGRSPPLWMFAWTLAVLLLVRGTVLSIAGVAPTLWVHLAVELSVLFAATWCSFAVLYGMRPVVVESPRFYIWLALGGAGGGGFASLAAPHLFHSTAEHPLALLFLVVFLPSQAPRLHGLDLMMVVGALLLVLIGRSQGNEAAMLEAWLLAGGFGMLLALAVRRTPSFGLALAFPSALALPYATSGDQPVVAAVRSEFGVHRVVEFRDADGARYHALQHGGVVHGWQCREPGRTQEPLGYYHPKSAVGEAFAWRQESSQGGDVAFIGLGAGGTLVYRKPQQQFAYFEIDPAVVKLASDPRCFSYIAEAGAGADVRLGDGRLLIDRAGDGAFETILLDAFSGDAVPTHLLTREAFAAYQRTLKRDGAVIVHVSSWFVDLEATVAKAGASVGMKAASKNQPGGGSMVRPGPAPTRCVVLMNDERRLEELCRRSGWSRLRAKDETPVWTDDFCDVWSVVRLRGR